MTTTLPRPADTRPANGGAPARKAVVRWAWRLFAREWRQQVLVLTLLVLAVTATTVGLALATSVARSNQARTFGAANHIVILAGEDKHLAEDIAAARRYFGTIDVITHLKVPVPGSVTSADLRAQDPKGPYARSMLRLDAGRLPSAPDEVAVTGQIARLFSLHIGDMWQAGGLARKVVGLVENPNDLLDEFALVPPGQINSPDATTSILVNAGDSTVRSFHPRSGTGIGVEGLGTSGPQLAQVGVLVVAIVGLLFVGLLAVGGFAVLAGRRRRAFGMLGTIGATDRHVSLVMLANGAAVGIIGAVTGAAAGLALWLAFAPTMETILEQRIDRFHLPWAAIVAAMLLAVITALAAAWWPARATARVSIVSALSGRPPRPRPAHRFAALGALLLGAGLGALVLADQRKTALIIAGIVATAAGILLLAPLTIRALAALASRAPFPVRLACRDLARYQARSGAALGAVTLAIGIAATIAVNAAASQAGADAKQSDTFPANQMIVHYAPGAHGFDETGLVQTLTPAQLAAAKDGVDQIAHAIGTSSVLTLERAVNPRDPNVPGPSGSPGGKDATALVRIEKLAHGESIEVVAPVFVATPEVLAHYGISADQIGPKADLLSSRTDLAGLYLFDGASRRDEIKPTIQQTPALPTFSSGPNTVITAAAVTRLGLVAVPVAWLIETPQPLTTEQIDAARKYAAGAGLGIETRPARQSLTELRNDATAAGIVVALGVLAMTVGLIRSETAGDLRTLTATGAASTTRRTITGATAGALALLGGLLGTAGAYAALLAWYHSDLHPFRTVPYAELLAIAVGLPLLATAMGWLLAGREPPAIARRPIE